MDYVKNELKNVYVFDLYTLLIFYGVKCIWLAMLTVTEDKN